VGPEMMSTPEYDEPGGILTDAVSVSNPGPWEEIGSEGNGDA
jgi:hypothetical protein